MKEYLEKRIEELKIEKARYMDAMTFNENAEPYREMYFETIAKMNELLDLQLKLIRGEINE